MNCQLSKWKDQMDATVDLLFSKFSFAIRNRMRSSDQTPTLDRRSSIPADQRRIVLHGSSICSSILGLEGVVPHTTTEIRPTWSTTNESIGLTDKHHPISEGRGGTGVEVLENIPQRPLSYDECYALCLDYANGTAAPFPAPRTPAPTENTASRISQHKSFTRVLLRLFSDVPYVSISGFKILWKWLKGPGTSLTSGGPVERKLGLAVLSCLLRSSPKGTETKRTAYAILLHLCFDAEPVLRQEALGFVHRKLLRNPTSLGEMIQTPAPHNTDISKNDGWDNYCAVGPWIEICTEFILRYHLSLSSLPSSIFSYVQSALCSILSALPTSDH